MLPEVDGNVFLSLTEQELRGDLRVSEEDCKRLRQAMVSIKSQLLQEWHYYRMLKSLWTPTGLSETDERRMALFRNSKRIPDSIHDSMTSQLRQNSRSRASTAVKRREYEGTRAIDQQAVWAQEGWGEGGARGILEERLETREREEREVCRIRNEREEDRRRGERGKSRAKKRQDDVRIRAERVTSAREERREKRRQGEREAIKKKEEQAQVRARLEHEEARANEKRSEAHKVTQAREKRFSGAGVWENQERQRESRGEHEMSQVQKERILALRGREERKLVQEKEEREEALAFAEKMEARRQEEEERSARAEREKMQAQEERVEILRVRKERDAAQAREESEEAQAYEEKMEARRQERALAGQERGEDWVQEGRRAKARRRSSTGNLHHYPVKEAENENLLTGWNLPSLLTLQTLIESSQEQVNGLKPQKEDDENYEEEAEQVQEEQQKSEKEAEQQLYQQQQQEQLQREQREQESRVEQHQELQEKNKKRFQTKDDKEHEVKQDKEREVRKEQMDNKEDDYEETCDMGLAKERELLGAYLGSPECAWLQQEDVAFSDEELDQLLAAGGGTAQEAIQECKYLLSIMSITGTTLLQLSMNLIELKGQKVRVLDFLKTEGGIFDSYVLKSKVQIGDVAQLYMEGGCELMTLKAIQELSAQGFQCRTGEDLVSELKKWRLTQDVLVAEQTELRVFLTTECQIFPRGSRAPELAPDDLRILINECGGLDNAFSECEYQEKQRLRVYSIRELRRALEQARQERLALGDFFRTSLNIFVAERSLSRLTDDGVFAIHAWCGGAKALVSARALEANRTNCVDMNDLLRKLNEERDVPKVDATADVGNVVRKGNESEYTEEESMDFTEEGNDKEGKEESFGATSVEFTEDEHVNTVSTAANGENTLSAGDYKNNVTKSLEKATKQNEVLAIDESDTEMVKWDKAATTIQAGIRGRQARKHVATIKSENAATEEELRMSAVKSEVEASQQEALVDGLDASDAAKRNRAATTIQASARGRQARKDVVSMKSKFSDLEVNGDESSGPYG